MSRSRLCWRVLLVGAVAAGAAAWSMTGPASADGTEQIVNGTFDTGVVDPWWSTAGTPISVVSGELCANIPVSNGNPWDAIFGQNDIDLVAGEDYTLGFVAHASRDVAPRTLVQLNGAPFTTWLDTRPPVGVTPQTFQYAFTAGETLSTAQLAFQLGGLGAAFTFCIDDVSLTADSPLDTTPPTVTGTPDRAPNGYGWYNAPVTVTWTATDPPPSSGTPTTPTPTVTTSEGLNLTVVSGPSCDPAGNCATGSYTVSVDTTPPAVTVTGVTNGATYPLGAVPTAGCGTTDALSGVLAPATLTVVDNGDTTVTASCDDGQDTAGNLASATATYTVVPAVYSVATGTKAISGNNSITATITTVPVPAGHTVTVAVATGTFAGAVGCADNRGNTYTVVADRNTGNGRLFVCSATAGTALTTGDTVTATYPGFSGLSVISVNAISGAVSTGTVGQTTTNTGNNAAPNSGPVTTTQAYQIVFGVVAHNSTPVLTPAAGYTTVGAVSGGSGSGTRTLTPMFRLAATPGTYTATGTLTAGQQWRAAAITYSSA